MLHRLTVVNPFPITSDSKLPPKPSFYNWDIPHLQFIRLGKLSFDSKGDILSDHLEAKMPILLYLQEINRVLSNKHVNFASRETLLIRHLGSQIGSKD
ncbi:hypothetical protein N665_0914s0002 [Sinapis alba]|nr:hypothetical protein N665_0914s0002 [Sinapis alba]